MEKYIALLKIVKLNSFTHAAEALGYTQPALSQMITSLEKELGVKLLNRSRSGISLTPEGQALYPSIEATIARYDTLREQVQKLTSLEDGLIRIATIPTLTGFWFPSLIEGFWQQYPNIRFTLHQGDYSTIPEMVSSGTVDIGIINPAMVKGLRTTFLKAETLKAVVPNDHPLATKKSVTLKELSTEPFLLLENGSLSAPLNDFHKEGLSPRLRLSAHDIYTIVALVEKKQGISILPSMALRALKKQYKVKIISIEPLITRKVGIATRENEPLPLACKYFIQYLLSQVDNL